MRTGGGIAALAVVALAASVPVPARADAADELTAAGEEAARVGDYTRAIAKFKEADRARPRARTACLIGLAYLRRELWPQAELFLARCRARANPDDLIPEWLSEAEQLLARKLAEVDVTAVTIVITPPEAAAAATVTVSSFAPDETFAPHPFHLAPGTHTIDVSAPGFEPARQTVELRGRGTRAITFALARPGGPAAVARPRRSSWPTRLWYVAGGAAVVGVGFHAWAASTRGKLVDAADGAAYDEHVGGFKIERDVAIGAYAVAVAAAATGLVLTFGHHGQEEVTVTGAPASGGAMVIVGWSR